MFSSTVLLSVVCLKDDSDTSEILNETMAFW